MDAAELSDRLCYRIFLGPHAGAGPCARHAIEPQLHDWAMSALIDDTRLIVGELVANAAKQGAVFQMRLISRWPVLRIEVDDRSSARPYVKTAFGDHESEDGRGLMVVDALADRWGYDMHVDGKTVWAELALR